MTKAVKIFKAIAAVPLNVVTAVFMGQYVSPMTYLTASLPETLIIHGTKDARRYFGKGTFKQKI